MSSHPVTEPRALALTALIVFQTVCADFFLVDVWRDIVKLGGLVEIDWHLAVELLASAGLLTGIAVEALVLRRVLARAERSERAVGIARGALDDLMEAYFRDWGLTPAEEDVAAFTLRGYSIAEIAGFRGSAEGTVKTHLNAIYRKAGVAGRGQLVSLMIEDLMQNPLVEPPKPPAGPPRAPAPALAGGGVAGALKPAPVAVRRR
jgi:DNA-binding CsgD family transcriptional regulator